MPGSTAFLAAASGAIARTAPAADAAETQTIVWLIVYLAVALVVSFLCSVAEAVLLSVSGGYIGSIRESHAAAAICLKRFRADPEEPLSAILTLNTIAHTVGAAGVGHEAAVLFGEKWLGLCSAILTLFILVGSEIIPKTLGATHWRSLAPMTALGVQFLVVVLKPLILVLRAITNRVTRRTSVERTRAEVESTILLASESSTLTADESLILRNLLRIRRVPVKEVMTPRVVVFSVPMDMTAGEFRAEHVENRFTRVLLYDGNIDAVNGYVLRTDILDAVDPDTPLSTWKRDVRVIPEMLTVSAAYEALSQNDDQIALVVNEFGDPAGIVTMEDLLETLIGREIVDESDTHPDLRKVAREKTL